MKQYDAKPGYDLKKGYESRGAFDDMMPRVAYKVPGTELLRKEKEMSKAIPVYKCH